MRYHYYYCCLGISGLLISSVASAGCPPNIQALAGYFEKQVKGGSVTDQDQTAFLLVVDFKKKHAIDQDKSQESPPTGAIYGALEAGEKANAVAAVLKDNKDINLADSETLDQQTLAMEAAVSDAITTLSVLDGLLPGKDPVVYALHMKLVGVFSVLKAVDSAAFGGVWNSTICPTEKDPIQCRIDALLPLYKGPYANFKVNLNKVFNKKPTADQALGPMAPYFDDICKLLK